MIVVYGIASCRDQPIGIAVVRTLAVARTPRASSMASTPIPALAPAGVPLRAGRGRLFRKYLLLILSLVTIALLASGAISIYFTYQETKSALAEPAARKGDRRGVAHRAVHPPDRAAARVRRAAAARRERRRAAAHRVPEAAAAGAGGHRYRAARRRRPRADRGVAPGHGQPRLGQGPLGRAGVSQREARHSPGSARCTSARRPSPT